MPKCKEYLRVLLTPLCWPQVQPYDAAWDAKLRALLRLHRFTDCNDYTATLGGYIIWLDNHPYGSFCLYRSGGLSGRPRRTTILAAHDQLLRDRHHPN